MDSAKATLTEVKSSKKPLSFGERWRALKSQKKKSKANIEYFGPEVHSNECLTKVNPCIDKIDLESAEDLTPNNQFGAGLGF